MNIKELKKKLQEMKIPSNIYNLEGRIYNTGTVLYKNYDNWEVININDKGIQEIINTFNSEEEACKFILNEFMKYKDIFNIDFKIKTNNKNKPTNLTNIINL